MGQPKIDVYTRFACGYCTRAKMLLEKKGAVFTEIDVTFGGKEREEMQERAPDARTLPQIFIGETHVGGCDDLYALDKEGKLDPLLQG
jgi:glutaredoxin 3